MKSKNVNKIPTQGVFGKFSNHVGYVSDFLDKEDSVASSTECTGLTPTPPTDFSQANSYTNLYPIPMQINNIDSENHEEIGGDHHESNG